MDDTFTLLEERVHRASERLKALAAMAYENGWSFLAGPLEGDGRMFSGGGRCATRHTIRRMVSSRIVMPIAL